MTRPETDDIRVAVAAIQIGTSVNGGLNSLMEILDANKDLVTDVITNRDGGFADWAGRNGVTSHVWPMRTDRRSDRTFFSARVIDPLIYFANNLRMWRLARRHRIGVLHCNDIRAFWNTAAGAKLAGCKVILNVRDTLPPNVTRAGRNWRTALRYCDVFLVLSKDMLCRWIAALAPLSENPKHAAKFRFIYSIVDRVRFTPRDAASIAAARQRLGLAPDTYVVACLGRFEHKKGQAAFIEKAAPALMGQVKALELHFVGGPRPSEPDYAHRVSELAQTSRYAARIHIENATGAAQDWFHAANTVLICSEREGLPRTLIEAITCGTPVIAFDVSSAAEILSASGCGAVAPLHDYAKLGQLIASEAATRTFERKALHAGPAFARENFDGGRNGTAYRELCSNLVGNETA